VAKELRPREGAYVAMVARVETQALEDGVVGIRFVDRSGQAVKGDVLPVILREGYAVIVGHPMEALGGYPAPERYTEQGVNRPPVCFAYASVPGPDVLLTDDVIGELADRARAMVVKRLKDQAAMEQAAQDG